MIEKIYSKVDGRLLHLINRLDVMTNHLNTEEKHREDLVGTDNFIQCSFLKMEEGHTFKPHRHIEKERTYEKQIAQESWVIVRGSVKCILYDLDDTIIAEPILKPGDASFTLYGGHNYIILEKDTIVYEYKTGPYEGQIFDKTFIKQ